MEGAAVAHPVDEHGFVLPDPSWPPGRHAPMPLERLRRFVNSSNDETGGERFRTPAALERWLSAEGLGEVAIDDGGRDRLVALRHALRELALANNPECGRNGGAPPPDPAERWAEVVRLVGDGAARVAVVDGVPVLRGAGTGAERVAAELAVIATSALQLGTWPRLKACGQCHWLFYDRSRNQAGAWCSMQVCGGRRKARSYRRRKRAAPDG